MGNIADAKSGNWVDRYAPPITRPYLRLARADRPIGTWLLLLPCLWSLALGALAWRQTGLTVSGGELAKLAALFVVGSFVMRAAGCTYNDIVDKDFDALVTRTGKRPIPAGDVTVQQAWMFLAALCLVGLAVLLQLSDMAVYLGAGSLALIALYPFMKRITWWPQAFLGLTFNWGALMGYAAITGTLGLEAIVLYLGAICWTIGYDTIYAHQDKADDDLIGLKSTALYFGENTKRWLVLFYSLAGIGITLSGALAGAGPGAGPWALFYILMAVAGAHLAWQVWVLDIGNAQKCLKLFGSNRDFGFLVLVAFLAGLMPL